MNIHAAAAYAGHLLRARSTAGHGVHSPLMFRFITEVIGGRAGKQIIEEVRSLRREMLSDNRVVKVTDLGAGSTVMGRNYGGFIRDASAPALHAESEVDAGSVTGLEGSETGPGIVSSEGITPEPFVIERSISRIAAVAALPSREVALLSRIAASLDTILERIPDQKASGQKPTRQLDKDREPVSLLAHEQKSIVRLANNPENTPHGEILKPDSRPVILELGTSLGISTLALALGAPHRRVITVEGCPELAAIARENLRRHGAENAEVLNMEFSQALSHLKSLGTKVEMAFIDGNHRGTALTEYVNRIREMGDEVIIVADDIRTNRDLRDAWRTLASSPFVSASIETFRLGMFFCLRNLTPGRYRIRY